MLYTLRVGRSFKLPDTVTVTETSTLICVSIQYGAEISVTYIHTLVFCKLIRMYNIGVVVQQVAVLSNSPVGQFQVGPRITLFVGILLALVVFSSLGLSAQVFDRLELLNCTRYGTSSSPTAQQQYVTDHAVDVLGNIYIVGYGYSAETTAGSFQPSSPAPAYNHVFVAKFNSNLSTLLWGTYVGGSKTDMATSIAVNQSGEVLIAGVTTSPNFPLSSATDAQYLAAGNSCNFVLKLSADGSRVLFSRLLAASAGNSYRRLDDLGTTIVNNNCSATYNSHGEVFVLGSCTTNFHTTANAYQATNRGGVDLSFTKLSADGVVRYSTYVGASGSDQSRDVICTDSVVYLGGSTTSSVFPLSVGNTDGLYHVFLMYWTDGVQPMPRASKILAGRNYPDDCSGLCYSSATSSVHMVGYETSSDFPITQKLKSVSMGSGGFLASFNRDLSTVNYVTLLGSLTPFQCVARANGDVYIVADAPDSVNMQPVSSTAWRLKPKGYDLMILGLHRSGAYLQYGSYFGGSGFDRGSGISIEETAGCGFNLVVSTRSTRSKADFPVTAGAYQVNTCNCNNTGLTKFRFVHNDTMTVTQSKRCGEVQCRVTTSPTQTCAMRSIQWWFGDGSTDTSDTVSVQHVYAKNGTYALRVRLVYDGPDTLTLDTNVTISTYPTIQVAADTLYRCTNDGGVQLKASGALYYRWEPSSGLSDSTKANPVAQPNTTTRYKLTASNIAGCTSEAEVLVVVSSLKVHVSADTTICEGGRAQLLATGAKSYTWFPTIGLDAINGSVVRAAPPVSTRYRVIGRDSLCADTQYVNVLVSHKPKFVFESGSTVCIGGSIKLALRLLRTDSLDTLGTQYRWSPESSLDDALKASPTASPSSTTTYRCTVTNSFGCSWTDSVQIKVQNSLALELPSDTLVCRGNTIAIAARGGAQYSWAPKDGLSDSSSAAPLCHVTGDVRYRVVTWNGDYHTASCRDTGFISVRSYNFPQVQSPTDTTVCIHSVIRLTAAWDSVPSAGRTVFEWRTAGGAVIGTSTSLNYRCDSSIQIIAVLSNAQGCWTADTTNVYVQTTLDVKAALVNDIDPGTQVLLYLERPRIYDALFWFDASKSLLSDRDSCRLSVSSSQWFYVQVKVGDCEGWDSVYVRVRDPLSTHACADTAVCVGEHVLLYLVRANPQHTYVWSHSSGAWQASGHSVGFQADSSRWYVVQDMSSDSLWTDSVFVQVYTVPMMKLRDTSVCIGTTLNLGGADSSTVVDYEWRETGGQLLSKSAMCSYTVAVDRSLSLTSTTRAGCKRVDTIDIHALPRAELRMSLSPEDTLLAGQHISLKLSLQLRNFSQALRFRALVHLPKALINPLKKVDSTSSDEYLVNIDTLLDQGQSSFVVLDLPVQILSSTELSARLYLSTVQLIGDTNCLDMIANDMFINVAATCGQSLTRLVFRDNYLSVAPNPSSGLVEITSSDKVEIVSELGLKVAEANALLSGETASLNRTALYLSSGVYFVHLANTPSKIVKLLVIH